MLGPVKRLGIVSFIIILSGCAGIPSMSDSCVGTGMAYYGECIEKPIVVHLPTHKELLNLPAPQKQPVVAVYKFPDLTGQRKQKGDSAMFSTAVSQGGATMLIDALKTAGKGSWFRVVERTNRPLNYSSVRELSLRSCRNWLVSHCYFLEPQAHFLNNAVIKDKPTKTSHLARNRNFFTKIRISIYELSYLCLQKRPLEQTKSHILIR